MLVAIFCIIVQFGQLGLSISGKGSVRGFEVRSNGLCVQSHVAPRDVCSTVHGSPRRNNLLVRMVSYRYRCNVQPLDYRRRSCLTALLLAHKLASSSSTGTNGTDDGPYPYLLLWAASLWHWVFWDLDLFRDRRSNKRAIDSPKLFGIHLSVQVGPYVLVAVASTQRPSLRVP